MGACAPPREGLGRPGIATAECSGAFNESDARVEILAVQRSAVQCGIGSTGTGASSSVPSSLAPTEGCSPRCLSSILAMSAPLPHSGAQQTDAASAASAGSVNHGSCLASHCPFESKAGGHRRVASSRCRPVRAKHKSELGREVPRACASDVRSP